MCVLDPLIQSTPFLSKMMHQRPNRISLFASQRQGKGHTSYISSAHKWSKDTDAAHGLNAQG